MTDWHYEDAGTARGPVSETDLATLLSDGALPASTRVWTASFGQDWRPASETVLAKYLKAGAPPPLAGAASASAVNAAPPPVRPGAAAGGSASNGTAVAYKPTYATLLALVLMIVMAIEIVALAAGVHPYDPNFQSSGNFLAVALSFFFVYKDASRINAAGLNPERRTLVPFLLLTQLGYFLRCRSVAGLPLTPLWLWLGSLVVYVIFYVVIYG